MAKTCHIAEPARFRLPHLLAACSMHYALIATALLQVEALAGETMARLASQPALQLPRPS